MKQQNTAVLDRPAYQIPLRGPMEQSEGLNEKIKESWNAANVNAIGSSFKLVP